MLPAYFAEGKYFDSFYVHLYVAIDILRLQFETERKMNETLLQKLRSALARKRLDVLGRPPCVCGR